MHTEEAMSKVAMDLHQRATAAAAMANAMRAYREATGIPLAVVHMAAEPTTQAVEASAEQRDGKLAQEANVAQHEGQEV